MLDPKRDGQGNFASEISDDTLWILFEEHCGSTKEVAKATGLSRSQVRKRLAKIRETKGKIVENASIDHAGKMESLVASIPLSGPGGAPLEEASVKLYGFGMKDELTQKAVKEGLESVGAVYKFRTKTPDFPLLQPAHPTIFAFDSVPRLGRKIRTAVVISDAQIGRTWRDGEMIPTHDPHAMDVAEQIIGAVEPDELDGIGDWMDWSMLSRWPKKPEYVNTTQQGIQDGYEWWARFIAAAGPRCKKKRKVKGNHDDRPAIFMREHNLEAMGLRRASDTTGWPVFSTEFLLRYDELGIEVTDPYPNGVIWLTDDLVLMHAPPKKLEMAASVIHGHTHKLTRETWAQTNHAGRVTYFRYDVGCLCKIDGSVPSDRARTDWAQGIAIVEIIDGKLPVHNVELIHIEPELTLYRGQEFRSSLLEEMAA